MIIYSLITIILVSLISIYFTLIYHDFKKTKIRINEAEAELDLILRKKFDLLNKSINIIRGNIKIDKDILENIIKLRSRKLSNFDFDRELSQANKEFNILKDTYSDLKSIDGFSKIAKSINEINEQLIGVKEYYNKNCNTFNKKIRLFPSNIIGLSFKYKKYQTFEDEI